jgi:hypothetical protein
MCYETYSLCHRCKIDLTYLMFIRQSVLLPHRIRRTRRHLTYRPSRAVTLLTQELTRLFDINTDSPIKSFIWTIHVQIPNPPFPYHPISQYTPLQVGRDSDFGRARGFIERVDGSDVFVVYWVGVVSLSVCFGLFVQKAVQGGVLLLREDKGRISEKQEQHRCTRKHTRNQRMTAVSISKGTYSRHIRNKASNRVVCWHDYKPDQLRLTLSPRERTSLRPDRQSHAPWFTRICGQ